MTSGIDLPWSPTMMTDWPDLALEFLRRPSRGRVFQYSNVSTYTAARVLSASVGDVGEYVDRALLAPLGIEGAAWERCPNGHVLGGSGLALRTEELARIGRLIRDRGRWRGEHLLSPEWMDAMLSEWVLAGIDSGFERYALAGWDGPGPGWRLDGAYGKLPVVAADAMVTITADHAGADGIAAFALSAISRRPPNGIPRPGESACPSKSHRVLLDRGELVGPGQSSLRGTSDVEEPVSRR